METIVRITENNLVEVTLEVNGSKQSKVISMNDYINALNASVSKKAVKSGKQVVSEIYPNSDSIHMIQKVVRENGSELFILLRNSESVDTFKYQDSIFLNVGVPKMIFGVEMFKGILQKIYVAAVMESCISKETSIYYYPFSHVSSPTSQACLGGNRMNEQCFKMEETNMIYRVPEMFLSMPSTDDYYRNLNKSQLQMRPLLEKLEGSKFDYSILRSADMSYETWIDKLVGK